MAARPTNVGRWWGLIYFMFAAGFGGWRGDEFWTWWNALTVFLPPVVFAGVLTARTAVRSRLNTAMTLLVIAVLSGSLLGGTGLLLAWGASAVSGPWADPLLRAAVPAVAIAAVYGLGLYLQRKPAVTGRPA